MSAVRSVAPELPVVGTGRNQQWPRFTRSLVFPFVHQTIAVNGQNWPTETRSAAVSSGRQLIRSRIDSTLRLPTAHEEYNVIRVPQTDALKLQKPKVDPHLQSAGERVKAAAEELERLGIADRDGERIRKDLPEDMREGADRDFGG
jgi:hypothetical protein